MLRLQNALARISTGQCEFPEVIGCKFCSLFKALKVKSIYFISLPVLCFRRSLHSKLHGDFTIHCDQFGSLGFDFFKKNVQCLMVLFGHEDKLGLCDQDSFVRKMHDTFGSYDELFNQISKLLRLMSNTGGFMPKTGDNAVYFKPIRYPLREKGLDTKAVHFQTMFDNAVAWSK